MTHRFPALFMLNRFTLALLTLSSPLFADDNIEHINVEGSTAGQTLSGHKVLLSKDDIQRQSAATSDTASLLTGLAGLHINATGGLSGLPAIHGLADDRLRVKVNGMDLIASCPNHMNPPLSYLAPTEVGQIIVFAGITPVSVGGDSIGGTIEASLSAPEFLSPGSAPQWSGEFGGFYRHNNQARGTNLNVQHITDNTFISYTGSWSKADNYSASKAFKSERATGRPNHQLPLDEVGSSAFENQNHTVRVAHQFADNLLDLQLNYQNMPQQLYPNQRMDLLNNEQLNLNALWQHNVDWGTVSIRLYHEQVDHMMDFGADKRFWYGTNAAMGQRCSPISFMGDPSGTCAAGMPMYSESDNTGLSVKTQYQIASNDVLRVGADIQIYRLDDYWPPSGGGMGPGTFENINNGQRSRSAVYVEREQSMLSDWMMLYGVRYENVTMDADPVRGYATGEMAPGMQQMNATAFNNSDRHSTDHNLDVTMVARYRASAELSTEFGYAHKVRSPNLYEKYTWSYWMMAAGMNNLVGDGNGYVGNVSLSPEKAHTISVSINWQDSTTDNSLVISPYYTYINDYIDAVAANNMWVENQFNVLRYENQTARLYGVDVTGNWHLSHGKTGHWQLTASLSATHSENTETSSALYQIIPLQTNLRLSHAYQGWQSEIEWQLASKKDDVSVIRNEIQTAGYGLINVRVGHQWDAFRVDIGVENLLDQFYFNPTGGTYTGQGVTMALNGIPYGIAVPGMGRSVYAGFSVNF
ncbi:MAG: TonB-dependent receptor [Alteromonadaceae bacterium]|nr:TonB-dependent receptor [Alteromonadaceae bacterium]